jgi:hypothetical protein
MPSFHFTVHSDLEPAEVQARLTDFGPARAEAWPNIDAARLQVHDSGPDWADVTEGSSVAGGVWERSRYEWSDGRVSAVTTSSNAWAPGSRWDYTLTPGSAGGTDVDVRVVRNGLGFKGGLIAILVGLAGTRKLRADTLRGLAR